MKIGLRVVHPEGAPRCPIDSRHLTERGADVEDTIYRNRRAFKPPCRDARVPLENRLVRRLPTPGDA